MGVQAVHIPSSGSADVLLRLSYVAQRSIAADASHLRLGFCLTCATSQHIVSGVQRMVIDDGEGCSTPCLDSAERSKSTIFAKSSALASSHPIHMPFSCLVCGSKCRPNASSIHADAMHVMKRRPGATTIRHRPATFNTPLPRIRHGESTDASLRF